MIESLCRFWPKKVLYFKISTLVLTCNIFGMTSVQDWNQTKGDWNVNTDILQPFAVKLETQFWQKGRNNFKRGVEFNSPFDQKCIRAKSLKHVNYPDLQPASPSGTVV